MQYCKPPLSYEQQADLLLERGLHADRETLIARLRAVNYYRLSGYLYPFRNADDTYRQGTTLDLAWCRYTFDRRLRLLVLDAIERVEVAIRTQLVYQHVHLHGPFGYTRPNTLPNLTGDRFAKLLKTVYDETQRSNEVFVKHFETKYGDCHAYLPLWMAAEVIPFGAALTLYRGVSREIKAEVARSLGQSAEVLDSWLLALNTIRNLCAHHSRLWNRTLGVAPKIPRANKHPQWHSPQQFANNRCYAILIILKYLLDRIAPQSSWDQRLRDLFREYPEIPLAEMGFPPNWEASPIWNLQPLP